MANIFMKLGKLKFKKGKGATVKFAGSDKISKQTNWFTIRSLNWRATRNVTMSIGDGMNRDSGMAGMSPVTFTKEMCGASEVILSRMLVPGTKGDTVDIVVTKPGGTGKGVEIYYHVQLTNARVVEVDINIAEGATAFECYAMAYSRILVKHWNEDEGGKLVPGGDVTYDLGKAKAISHAIVKAGG